jgi:ribosomal protein S15P/S13E
MSNEKSEETIEETQEEKEKKVSKSKKISQSEYEQKILELAETGLTAEKIGENLRKQNIHPKEYNKTISQILKGKNKYINPDLKNIEKKLNKVQEHYKNNKKDKRAMREKDRIFSQLRTYKKYFGVPVK